MTWPIVSASTSLLYIFKNGIECYQKQNNVTNFPIQTLECLEFRGMQCTIFQVIF